MRVGSRDLPSLAHAVWGTPVSEAQYRSVARARRSLQAKGLVSVPCKRSRAALFTSESAEWETPQDLFGQLAEEFGPFDLDPCCRPETAKCARYFTKADDGLAQRWEGRVFVNPPYGREIGRWVQKAWEESQRGATVVLLIPARTDTAYWHEYCSKGEVRFLRGRVCFNHARKTGPAPFPSAVVVFRPAVRPSGLQTGVFTGGGPRRLTRAGADAEGRTSRPGARRRQGSRRLRDFSPPVGGQRECPSCAGWGVSSAGRSGSASTTAAATSADEGSSRVATRCSADPVAASR